MYLRGDIEPVLCGRFDLQATAAGAPVGSFVYGKSYLALGDALPVDPILLRLEEKTYQTTALNGWFSALLDSGPDASEVAMYSFQGSYTHLARQLRVWERSPTKSVRELYRRIVFNALVGNTDDHDKNHGVVAGADGEFTLSPAFDLTIRATPRNNNYLAMAFGADGARIALENLTSECEVFGYAKADATELIHRQWQVISERLMNAIIANGSPEQAAARTCALMPGNVLLSHGKAARRKTTTAAPRSR